MSGEKSWDAGKLRLTLFWGYGGFGFQVCKPAVVSPYWVFGLSVTAYRENRGTDTGHERPQ